MKAIVGIDADRSYRSTVRLLARIGFRSLAAELVHVDAESPGKAGPLGSRGGIAVVERGSTHVSRLLENASAEAQSLGLNCTVKEIAGIPARMLVSEALSTHADLIVLGSSPGPGRSKAHSGAVARGILISSPKPVLVSKGDWESSGPLKAVYATDGSAFGDECLQLLVRMQPGGIKSLTIVTAVSHYEQGEPPKAIKKHVTDLAEHLWSQSIPAEARVLKGDPIEVIERAMKAAEADLLILAAQGHGLLGRLVGKSVSMHEVLETSNSVLVLRK